MLMGGKIPPGLSRVQGHLPDKISNGYTHVFEVHLFNVVDDITGSRVIPEIDMAAAQTGSYRISMFMTAIHKSPTATHLKMDIQQYLISYIFLFFANTLYLFPV